MPTIRIVGDNTIEFVDSSGNVAAREQYDEGASQLSFEDANGNPMPIALGDTEVSGSLSTGAITGGGRPYSTSADFSDVSVFYQDVAPSSKGQYTLLDLSDGPKTVLSLHGFGWNWEDKTSSNVGSWTITRDGTTSTFPGGSARRVEVEGGARADRAITGPFRYDNTLKIEWEHGGTSQPVLQEAHILGSGPHWAAVVSNGECPYSTARNVSTDQISAMNPPDGYSIVTDPDVSDSVDDVWDAVWDAEKEMFVSQS
jgi:hypothetical protein